MTLEKRSRDKSNTDNTTSPYDIIFVINLVVNAFELVNVKRFEA